MRHSVLAAVFASLIAGAPATRAACAKPKQTLERGPAEIEKFFSSRPWQVVTFLGYSGAEYEDPNAMLKQAGAVLDGLDAFGLIGKRAHRHLIPFGSIARTVRDDDMRTLTPDLRQRTGQDMVHVRGVAIERLAKRDAVEAIGAVGVLLVP